MMTQNRFSAKSLLATLLLAGGSLATPAHADTLSISVGAGGWNESPSGTIQKKGDPAKVDVEKQLLFSSETQGYFFVTFEHFVPLVPNVRLLHTSLSHNGSGSSSFVFDGQTFSGNVVNDLKLTTTDLIAYYEILDNIVSLDLGVTVRKLDIDYTFKSTSGGSTVTSSNTVSQTVPMLYALVGASPWPDLIVSGEINYLSYAGNTLSDITAKVAYTTSFFVGFEAGYRKQTITLDDVDSTNADITFDGLFVGAYVKF